MKRNPWLVAALIISVVVIVLGLAARLVLPGLVRDKVLEAARKACDDCTVYIKKADVSFAHPGLVTFTDVRFAAGQGGHSMVEARMKSLAVDVALTKSNQHLLTIDDVTGDGVEVIYADGDTPAKKEPEKKSGHSMEFVILGAHLDGAMFRYVHTANHQTSILHIKEIKGSLSAIGNTPELVDKIVEADLTGVIEKSGKGQLKAAAKLAPGPFYVDVLLDIKGQKLDDLNGFFTISDGIELHGTMEHVLANVNVRGDDAKSHVEATYKDADFNQLPTHKTSPVEAFFTNIGAALLMTKTNVDRLPIDRATEIHVARDPKTEPIVHYIIRSMKLALLDVVKKPDSRGKKK